MDPRPITDAELAQFQGFIFDKAGITMAASKKALVMGRLGKRLKAHQLESFGEYFRLLSSGQDEDEVQVAVNLLTTNETYFFRDFPQLAGRLRPPPASRDQAL